MKNTFFRKYKKTIYPVLTVFFLSQITAAPAWSQVAPLQENASNVPTVSTTDETEPDTVTETPVENTPPTLSDQDNPLSPATTEAEATPAPQAAAVPANVTVFPGKPVITTFSNEAVITVDQKSSSQFNLNYDINTPGSFGGAIINFGASPAGAQDLSVTTTYEFLIATNNACPASGPCLKIEFLDAAGQLAVAEVSNLTATPTDVDITQAELLTSNPAFDFTRVQQINFVVDENVAPVTKTGFYDIQAGGLAFTPVLTAQTPAGTPTQLPGQPTVTTFANQATATPTEVTPGVFRIDYDVTTAGSFAGGIINYDPAATGTFQDLSGFQNLVFNLSSDNVCTSGKCLKIEIVDSTNQAAIFDVQGVNGTSNQVTILRDLILEANAAIDLTHIRQINFVIEEGNTNPKAGFLSLETGGFGGTTPPPGPDPDPNPNPDPDPDPNPNPNPNGTLFTGITEGQAVSGNVVVQPDLAQIPDVRKVAYYLNGTKAGRAYDSPFTWGGEGGVDTSQLPDGEYELTAVYTTPEGDQTVTVRFSVNNGNTSTPEPQPQTAPAEAITGLTANQTVSATDTITVRPDLAVVPNVHKVFYYLDGQRLDKVYEAPYAVTLDSEDLTPGAHVLTVAYGTTDGDFMNSGEFSAEIPFTVA